MAVEFVLFRCVCMDNSVIAKEHVYYDQWTRFLSILFEFGRHLILLKYHTLLSGAQSQKESVVRRYLSIFSLWQFFVCTFRITHTLVSQPQPNTAIRNFGSEESNIIYIKRVYSVSGWINVVSVWWMCMCTCVIHDLLVDHQPIRPLYVRESLTTTTTSGEIFQGAGQFSLNIWVCQAANAGWNAVVTNSIA